MRTDWPILRYFIEKNIYGQIKEKLLVILQKNVICDSYNFLLTFISVNIKKSKTPLNPADIQWMPLLYKMGPIFPSEYCIPLILLLEHA